MAGRRYDVWPVEFDVAVIDGDIDLVASGDYPTRDFDRLGEIGRQFIAGDHMFRTDQKRPRVIGTKVPRRRPAVLDKGFDDDDREIFDGSPILGTRQIRLI